MKIFQAMNMAQIWHAEQKYGETSYYEGHLLCVLMELHEQHVKDEDILVAGVLHDSVEDTDVSLDEVRSLFGSRVAEIVWAVTGVGHNRRQRNLDAYTKIQAAGVDALRVKLADRIINVRSCLKSGDSRISMYRKEHPSFRAALAPIGLPEVWAKLDTLLVADVV